MNRKGFTLIELLACLVILSIIMLIAVPSTLNILDKNKKDSYISDAKKLITLAEAKLRTDDTIEYPTSNQIIVMSLSYLNNGDIDKTPDGGDYTSNSYVAITYKGSSTAYSYNFAVQLSSSQRSVVLSTSQDLVSDTRYSKVSKSGTVSKDCASIASKLNISNPVCKFY